MNKRWPFNSPGIPDYFFKRARGVPMTKQEVRAISISQLRLFPGATVYDIGAGTGSVGIECALLGCGKVFAVERNPVALRLIRENIELFELENMEVVTGEAPEIMAELPAAHRIFLGGSGGNWQAILEAIMNKLKPGGWLVVNSITLETGYQVLNFLDKHNFTGINVTSVNISRAVPRGRVRLWQALNPVQVLSGQKGEN